MPKLRIVLVLALLAGAALAGCAAPVLSAQATTTAPAAIAANWWDAALAHDPGHNHFDRAQHNASTSNFQLVARDPLLTDHYGGRGVGMYGCGDSTTRADGRRLAVVDAWEDDLSFVVVDVTDAAHPQKVGEFYAPGTRSWDAALTRDGRFALLAIDSTTRSPQGVATADDGIFFRSACTGQSVRVSPPDVAVTRGIYMVDITNPAAPKFADWDPTPAVNMHSVSSAEIDGVQYVMGSVVNFQHTASYFVFDRIVDTPLGSKLVRLSTFAPPPVAPGLSKQAAPVWSGHTDLVMARSPVDGMVYAYLAAWDGGVVILDMTVPAAPVFLSEWVPPRANVLDESTDLFGACFAGAIHTVLPAPQLWEGKYYLFAGQECPVKNTITGPGGSVFVLDVTNPVLPTQVGEWHLPADTGLWTIEYQASPHYVALVDRTLFVSDYHAGLWAVDVGPGKLASPPSIGVYLPVLAPPAPPMKASPTPFDEQVDAYPDGTILLNDDSSGLYVLRFDPTNPAPAAPPYPYG